MVFIKSCENCKNDCENGMGVNGLPHKFCGKLMLGYFCPINQGIYEVSLETARKHYGYRGKAFEELDIREDYGIFQEVVENLAMIGVNKPFSTNEVFSLNGADYIEFSINLPEYSVFQVNYRQKTKDFSYYGGSCNHRIVGYCDTIRITVDNQMVGLIGHKEVFRLTDNHIDYGSSEGVYSVSFRHLK